MYWESSDNKEIHCTTQRFQFEVTRTGKAILFVIQKIHLYLMKHSGNSLVLESAVDSVGARICCGLMLQ